MFYSEAQNSYTIETTELCYRDDPSHGPEKATTPLRMTSTGRPRAR
jgi:hypothetical protein